MRRLALIGLPLLLAGCNYAGNPFDGFGTFAGDVHSIRLNPNKPLGDADNLRRVSGAEVETEPLLPEDGNIWPGPLPPARSLSDLQREPLEDPARPPADQQPSYGAPRAAPPRGSSTPPNPGNAAPMSSNPPRQPSAAAPPATTPPAQAGRVLQTPNGPVSTIQGGNGVETFIQPGGRSGVVINNGNGTSTMIGTDGSTISVPATR